MLKNEFTEILEAWKYLTNIEKVRILQNFEHKMSEIEGRTEREIVYYSERPAQNGIKPTVLANFNFDAPDVINIFDLSSPIQSLDSILHENFHADVRRFLSGDRDLRAFAEIDKNRFFNEEKLIDIIYSYYANYGILDIFGVCFYEEVLAYENTALKLMKVMYDSAENLEDLTTLAPIYTNEVLFKHYNYLNWIDKNDLNSFHEQTMRIANSLGQTKYANKVKLYNPDKKIIRVPESDKLSEQLKTDLYVTKQYASGKLKDTQCAGIILEEMKNYKEF